jgi:hypothetical protein
MGDIRQKWRKRRGIGGKGKRRGVHFGYLIFIPSHKANTSSVSFLLILVNKTQYSNICFSPRFQPIYDYFFRYIHAHHTLLRLDCQSNQWCSALPMNRMEKGKKIK